MNRFLAKLVIDAGFGAKMVPIQLAVQNLEQTDLVSRVSKQQRDRSNRSSFKQTWQV